MWTEHCTQPGQSSEYYRYCFLCGCLLRLEKILLTSPVLNPYKEEWQGQAPSLLQIQVRFQEYRPFITGKSQGGVLSPTLFKISINDKYPLPDGCKIIFYTDDHAIIASERNIMMKTQHFRDLLFEEYGRFEEWD